MELIVISKSKLKIMLTAPDMIKYDLTSPPANSLSLHDREVLRHLFRDAKAEIGFDTEGARLFVQLYSSKEGGCEIFVTKLPDSDPISPTLEREEPSAEENCSVDFWTRPRKESPNTLPTSEDRLLQAIYETEEQNTSYVRKAYRFFDLDSLLAVCRRLGTMVYTTDRPPRSHVYIVDRETCSDWYLILEHPSFEEPDLFLFLSEYAVSVDHDHTVTYLAEHGKLIASANAVDIMKRL